MKSMAISPDIIQKNSSGRQQAAIGNLIRLIETKTPAEWLKEDGREMYEDAMEIGSRYINNYITRSIKNIMTGTVDLITIDEDGNEVPPGF